MRDSREIFSKRQRKRIGDSNCGSKELEKFNCKCEMNVYKEK